VGIGTRTGERLMTKPEIRQVVEQTRTAGDGDPAIRALLEATDEAGNPDWPQRLKGAELAFADPARESGGRELASGLLRLSSTGSRGRRSDYERVQARARARAAEGFAAA
jgi:hypothetical protein